MSRARNATALSSFVIAGLATLTGVPVSAATLIGQEIAYCTDSTRDGSVSNNPADCDFVSVNVSGTATIGPAIEIILDQGGVRRLDFFAASLDIIYQDVGSFSPDLFVISGFTAPITSISLATPNPLNVSWVYGGGSLGVLVGSPLENGTVTLSFSFDRGGIIPEPASWAMLIAGFGMVGAVARRHRRFEGSAVRT